MRGQAFLSRFMGPLHLVSPTCFRRLRSFEMSYGLTLDQVRKTNRPAAEPRQWGSVTSLTSVPEYAMYRVDLLPGVAQPMHFYANGYHAFVESGDIIVRSLDGLGRTETGFATTGDVLPVGQFWVHGLASKSGAVVYLFGARVPEGPIEHLVEPWEEAAVAMEGVETTELQRLGDRTSDVREKYWGRIETILSGDVAAKRIFLKNGSQGSLEYHVEKRGTYYVHSGTG